jgi:prephenate dehydrogenase
VKLTVIGLDKIGISIGLTLGKKGTEMQITGFDLDRKKVESTKKTQAFNQVTDKLKDAVKSADLVLIDLPIDEVTDIFTRISQCIKTDAVLLYFSALPEKAAGWARQQLPENGSFVALTPAINPKYIEDLDQLSPHDDLFENSQIIISHFPSIPTQAIQIATDLTIKMGATPCFADLAEVDGLQTIAQFLPRIIAAAVMDEVVNEPGWKDARKLAGNDLANATRLLNLILDENQGQVLIDNKENSLRMIVNMQNSLAKLAQLIHVGDSQKLQETLENLRMERDKWLANRKNVLPGKKYKIFGRK